MLRYADICNIGHRNAFRIAIVYLAWKKVPLKKSAKTKKKMQKFYTSKLKLNELLRIKEQPVLINYVVLPIVNK